MKTFSPDAGKVEPKTGLPSLDNQERATATRQDLEARGRTCICEEGQAALSAAPGGEPSQRCLSPQESRAFSLRRLSSEPSQKDRHQSRIGSLSCPVRVLTIHAEGVISGGRDERRREARTGALPLCSAEEKRICTGERALST